MPRNNSQQSKDLAAAAFAEQNNKIKNSPRRSKKICRINSLDVCLFVEANNINKAARDKGPLFYIRSPIFLRACAQKLWCSFSKNLFLSRWNENEMEEQLSLAHTHSLPCFILLFLTSAKNLWRLCSFLVCARGGGGASCSLGLYVMGVSVKSGS